MSFDSIESALEAIRRGEMIIVVDDEDRENEGDFIMAAQHCGPKQVNFMLSEGRGMLCAPVTMDRAAELKLNMMVSDEGNNSLHGTPFTVSVDYKHGTFTGISTDERSLTLKKLAEPETVADDFARPGHIHPLRARNGGVLRRAGHTEATVDLCRLAGLEPSGVLIEILNADGTVARLPQLEKIREREGLKLISIADLIKHRRIREKTIKRLTSARLPTVYGEFTIQTYQSTFSDEYHLALVMGKVDDGEPVLCRVHSECLTGDTFHSQRCDCGEQLDTAMRKIAAEGRGVLLYMNQEGRGIGLLNKIHAYHLQDLGRDTVEANEELGFAADLRDYGFGAQMLVDLGIKKLRLMTNNPRKLIALEGYGLEIVERVHVESDSTDENRHYLRTKRDKLGHLLKNVDEK